ncbi:thiopurine S-methyltransferase [Psychrobacter sp.]|uniref:thiopurine S-methyltransferase n=1 Tax=Psychrobacter sp. TaxID=56811 RepID=UPI003C76A3FB
MNPEFWKNAWQKSQTNFTQKKPNPMLIHHFKALNTHKNSRVFVPLCGKSVDMLWFTSQGFDVIGVELSEIAVTQFLTENDLQATVILHPTTPDLTCYQSEHQGQTLEIWVGDIFDLSPIDIGVIDAVYDRGALVAFPDIEPDNLRTHYTQQIMALSNSANQLLLSFAYDGEKQRSDNHKNLPPFLVTRSQLEQYYAEYYEINLITKEKVDYVSTAGDSGYRLVYALVSKN